MTRYSAASGNRPEFSALDNLRTNAGGIAESDANAKRHLALSSTASQQDDARARVSDLVQRVNRRRSGELERADVSLLPEAGEPEFLLSLRFFLHQLLFDLGPHFGERAGVAAVLFVDFQDVIIAAELDDVADPARREIESDFFQRRRQRFALDPSPVAAEIARAVLRINLRHAIEGRAISQLAQNFLRDRFLRGRFPFVGVGRDHDHAQLDLLLGREFGAMLCVVFGNFGRRNHRVQLHVLAPHRLDDDSFLFLFLEFGQRIILRLERLDERLAIATETFPDDFVHSLVDEMVRKFEFFLGEGLHDQLPIDQILQRGLPGRLDLFRQFFSLELRLQ